MPYQFTLVIHLQSRRHSRCRCIWHATLKPGFHYPSWRPELTTRVDWWPVSITRQHEWCWQARISTSRVDGPTRVVETRLNCYKSYLYLSVVQKTDGVLDCCINNGSTLSTTMQVKQLLRSLLFYLWLVTNLGVNFVAMSLLCQLTIWVCVILTHWLQ